MDQAGGAFAVASAGENPEPGTWGGVPALVPGSAGGGGGPSGMTPRFLMLSYDVLLIDTSPSLGLLTINALNASDYALIPVSCDFLSLVGLTLLFDTIRLCQEQLGSPAPILGRGANRYSRREKVSAEVLNALKQRFNILLFETVVRV